MKLKLLLIAIEYKSEQRESRFVHPIFIPPSQNTDNPPKYFLVLLSFKVIIRITG